MKRILILLGLMVVCTNLFGELRVDQLYYEVIGDNEVRFTRFDESLIRKSSKIGRLEIPAYIEYEGATYTVTELGDRCFENGKARQIYDLLIPHTIKRTGTDIFGEIAITRLWFSADFPFPAHSKQFGSRGADEFEYNAIICSANTIYVPEGTLHRYSNAPGFKNIYADCRKEYPGLKAKKSPYRFLESDGCVIMPLDTTIGNSKAMDAIFCYGIEGEFGTDGFYDIPSTLTIEGAEYTICQVADEAFYYKSNGTSAHVPSTVTKLGMGVFGRSNFEEITGMENVQEMGNACFASRNLKRLKFPSKMELVPDRCFADYDADRYYHIELIDFHENVKHYGDDIFYEINIDTMICRNPKPVPVPIAKDGSPFGPKCTFGTLYVPGQSLELYKDTEGWNKFAEILPIDAYTGIEQIENEFDQIVAPEYFNMQGVRVSELQRGNIYIERRGKDHRVIRY